MSLANENYTFWGFLIDFLSVLNELNLLLIGEYSFFAAKITGSLFLHDFIQKRLSKASPKTSRNRLELLEAWSFSGHMFRRRHWRYDIHFQLVSALLRCNTNLGTLEMALGCA